MKVRLEPGAPRGEPRVHPGHDWLYVLEGRILLTLGERQMIVEAGEAAEFSTMTPHAIDAIDGVAELLMVFDGDGQRAHSHTD
ncbi:cupin domain-containing protein [Salinilacustrithrix flava]|uniref:cupin domain-containing protein n=1 Tax=Salinilacustrithrix flava TaxID=2957203 RepID=UPI003D7C166E